MTSEARSLNIADEDGFHEIQLNGKQLVFLGMTTTLVSVVIFLCGVLVGRGVKPVEPVAEAASVAAVVPEPAAAAPIDTPPPDPAPETAEAAAPAVGEVEPPPPPVPAPEAPAVKTPEPKPAAQNAKLAEPKPAEPKQAEQLSYYNALQKGGAKASASAKGSPESMARPAAAEVAAAAAPAPPPAVAEAASAPPPARAAEPAAKGGAVAVQVAALSSRTDAEAVARRLSGKGYAAYVLSPDPGAKAVFKVRVGNYASTDEAERVSRRLRQEEKLQPWVIR